MQANENLMAKTTDGIACVQLSEKPFVHLKCFQCCCSDAYKQAADIQNKNTEALLLKCFPSSRTPSFGILKKLLLRSNELESIKYFVIEIEYFKIFVSSFFR